jgi:hypothetical protein
MEDRLPASAESAARGLIDSETVRHVGTLSDWQIYIGRAEDTTGTGQYCLLMDPGSEPLVACNDTLPFEFTSTDGALTVVFAGPDGQAPDGFVALSPSVHGRSSGG